MNQRWLSTEVHKFCSQNVAPTLSSGADLAFCSPLCEYSWKDASVIQVSENEKGICMEQMKEGQIGELNLPGSKGDLYVQGNVRCLAKGIATILEHHQKSLYEHSLGMCIWNKWFQFEMTCHLDAAEETV